MSGAAGQRRLGTLLVVLQFALITVVAWLALPAFVRGAAPVLAWGLAAAGMALGAWTLQANPLGNFNIRPTPRDGGRLVHSGPYRWIRHPMYSCVALCAVAGAYASGAALAWLATAALATVLFVKASFEERWMAGRHPSYAAYRSSTRRFIPGLF